MGVYLLETLVGVDPDFVFPTHVGVYRGGIKWANICAQVFPTHVGVYRLSARLVFEFFNVFPTHVGVYRNSMMPPA